MALVTVQRSPSPSNTAESVDVEAESPNRSRRSKSALKRLKKLFHTVRFISKLRPCFSESYFTVKGAALILPQNDDTSTYTKKICKNSHGDIQSHLESMIALLRRQDTIAVAVKLEVNNPDRHKYMAVVSCMGKQDTEESVILGIDFVGDKQATIGLVLPIWADTVIDLDGDGGFSIKSGGNRHLFKPVTVQVMWFTLQSLNKLVKIACDNKYIAHGLSHTWVTYYEASIKSDIPRINEWHLTEDLLFFKAEPVLLPTDCEEQAFLKRISVELKNVMMKEDLDEATSKYLRTKLEEQMHMSLDQWKGFIDKEMLTILGQMDSPTLIKDYLYLGSEWNASNIEELTHNGVQYIMNISREIDNFFPGILHYYNLKEWDSEETDMLKHWENTHKYISKIRDKKGKILVHCKMGISRSASTVLAYLMKEYNMSRQQAYDYVKERRSCIMPNKAFWQQLETYEGILNASKQRHIFKQKSESNMAAKVKQEDKEAMSYSEIFLEENQWGKGLDESYSDVFLKDISDSCSQDFDTEIGSSSRSADSHEEYYPDLPSPEPEGATGGTKEFLVGGNDYSETSEEEEEKMSVSPVVKTLPPQLKITSTCNIIPKITLTKPSVIENQLKFENNETVTSSIKIDTNQRDQSDLQGQNDIDIAEIEGDCDIEKSKVKTPLSELGIHQHYHKENIPWSAGTVKKTKEGIEEKYKDKLPNSRSRKLSDDTSVETTTTEDITFVVAQDIAPEKVFWTIDGVTESDSNDNKAEDDLHVEKISNAKRPTSVYDVEDISLPPGIVRRTTQEIEERNRMGDDTTSSHVVLQRSSSLKTERDTPRKKRRNSERRKTITPILSPCSSTSDASPNKDVISLSDTLGVDSVFQTPQPAKECCQPNDFKETIVCDKKKESDQNFTDKENTISENLSQQGQIVKLEPDLAVYKFLGEEVSLQKGIVKKQKMGIELMNQEKFESGSRNRKTSENEGSSSNPSTPTEGKKVNKGSQKVEKNDTGSVSCALFVEKPIATENSEGQSKDMKERIESKPETVLKPVSIDGGGNEEKLPLFSEAKKSFEKASIKVKESDETLLHTPPKSNRKPEPRFDAATLELIREIGSAILNSPAKSKVENFQQEEAQLGSGLVRHYVKNIELQTKNANMKKAKEIIIIDKESQEKKNSWRWSNPTDQKQDVSPKTDQSSHKDTSSKPLTHSVSSPILSSRKIIQSGKNKGNESELSGSLSQKGGESPQKKTVENNSDQTSSKKTSPTDNKLLKDTIGDDNGNVLGVRNLVGKYEGSCPQVGSLGSTSSLSDIKEVNSCESLKGLDRQHKAKEMAKTEIDSAVSKQSDSEESTNEDCARLRKIRNRLRKTSLHSLRPKSVELVRRNSAAPALGFFGEDSNSQTDESQSGFPWEGRKVRKLQGKSHPLTKLEWRKKFYNTM